jgi:hypothetical protein
MTQSARPDVDSRGTQTESSVYFHWLGTQPSDRLYRRMVNKYSPERRRGGACGTRSEGGRIDGEGRFS